MIKQKACVNIDHIKGEYMISFNFNAFPLVLEGLLYAPVHQQLIASQLYSQPFITYLFQTVTL
jgi:hypothetical protein